MALHEKEILEALSSSRILSSMITPAVLISACGTLIFSTSARLGRIFDRVNVMKGEVEGVISGKLPFPEKRLEFLKVQVSLAKTRAALIQKALACLYMATALFVASSLGIAVNVAFGHEDHAWIPTALALTGGLFLFAASALLLYESRFNLRFVNRNIEFIEFLEQTGEQAAAGHDLSDHRTGV